MSAIDLTLGGYDLFRLAAQENPQPAASTSTANPAKTTEDRIAALPLNRLLYLALIEKSVCAE